jgi:CubicO group peptidase (beta-lactamase class C family)
MGVPSAPPSSTHVSSNYARCVMGALEQVSTWPVSSSAAGYLVGPPRSGAPRVVERVGALGESFRWASVTKLCTTMAALVALEEGTISLDDPAGPPGSTVAHLLAHASGLGLGVDDPVRPPATRRVYSNAGFELLASTIAAHASMPFASYLSEAVLEPLGMRTATLEPHASPASGMVGRLDDLLALARELLAPRTITSTTLTFACRVAFEGLDGVLPGFGWQHPCDWGLGFEVRDEKDPHWTASGNSPETFGHFGQSGAFLWVDPLAGVACAVLTDRDFGPWALEAWPALSSAVLEAAGHPDGG